MLKLLLSSVGVFMALSVLANNLDDESKIKNSAREVEEIFIARQLKTMNDSVHQYNAEESSHSQQIYKELLAEEHAKEIAKVGGVGLQPHIIKDIKTKAHNKRG